MTGRRFLVAYDGSDEAYWALMQAARAATETGAEIGIVTVLSMAAAPTLATAAQDAVRILREHQLEATVYTLIGILRQRLPVWPRTATTRPSISDAARRARWLAS